MATKSLRVRAVADIRVVNLEAMRANARRFVGREWNEDAQDWLASGDVTVPSSAEYLAALRAGDLAPADEATAKAAGIKFTSAPAAVKPSKETV